MHFLGKSQNTAYVTKPDLIPALLYDPFSATYAALSIIQKMYILPCILFRHRLQSRLRHRDSRSYQWSETVSYTHLQSLTGRTIWNAYPVIWLLPESNTKTMQLPSSVGQDRIILFPGNEIMKVRNTKHYDNIYRKTNSYHTKQRASVWWIF